MGKLGFFHCKVFHVVSGAIFQRWLSNMNNVPYTLLSVLLHLSATSLILLVLTSSVPGLPTLSIVMCVCSCGRNCGNQGQYLTTLDVICTTITSES